MTYQTKPRGRGRPPKPQADATESRSVRLPKVWWQQLRQYPGGQNKAIYNLVAAWVARQEAEVEPAPATPPAPTPEREPFRISGIEVGTILVDLTGRRPKRFIVSRISDKEIVALPERTIGDRVVAKTWSHNKMIGHLVTKRVKVADE